MTSNQRSIDDRPTQDRETLCALFDGELRGDEARFALKRLGHDVQWRDTVGRWQLYGDALRGQAQGIAGSGFADRVALAIREEESLHVAMPAKAVGGRRAWAGGWMGGALAASVAVAALFVTRPFTDDAPSTGDRVSPQVASAPGAAAVSRIAAGAASRTPVAPAATPATPGTTDPQSPGATLAASAAAVAAIEAPRRASRAARNTNPRVPRVTRAIEQPTVASADIARTAVADATPSIVAPTPAKPFQPEHMEPASRPWPRAVLPQYGGSGALTASFGGNSAASPSFYPFEPQTAMPAAEESPAPRESQD